MDIFEECLFDEKMFMLIDGKNYFFTLTNISVLFFALFLCRGQKL